MSGKTLYKNIKTIEAIMTEKTYNTDGKDTTNNVIFQNLVYCFNDIAETVRYNRKLPYFNLKENWALIKAQNFEQALTNVKSWLIEVEDRYDGENWTEKH